MKFLLISFKSKSSLYSFSRILKFYNIEHSIINTPHAISRSCSLSLKVNLFYKSSVINMLRSSQIDDIVGIFILEKQGFNERIQRLYWLYFIFLLL